MLQSTGLAGLEPTTYGLGNRRSPLAHLGSGLDLPNHLPKWGSKRPTGSAQKRTRKAKPDPFGQTRGPARPNLIQG